jgi:hypothetical protein
MAAGCTGPNRKVALGALMSQPATNTRCSNNSSPTAASMSQPHPHVHGSRLHTHKSTCHNHMLSSAAHMTAQPLLPGESADVAKYVAASSAPARPRAAGYALTTQRAANNSYITAANGSRPHLHVSVQQAAHSQLNVPQITAILQLPMAVGLTCTSQGSRLRRSSTSQLMPSASATACAAWASTCTCRHQM